MSWPSTRMHAWEAAAPSFNAFKLARFRNKQTQLFGVVNKIDGLCALGQIAAAIPSAWRSCSPAAQRW